MKKNSKRSNIVRSNIVFVPLVNFDDENGLVHFVCRGHLRSLDKYRQDGQTINNLPRPEDLIERRVKVKDLYKDGTIVKFEIDI